MYRIYLTNFGWFTDQKYDSLVEAIQAAREAHFEASIHFNETLVATWSPIGGVKYV